ncbi:MAG: DUF4830 domain-containing protein [Oscillospiraceae bacterium]|nr:DUF4830 domain-containing protein [Oscillospiraceae bacterium]
MKKHLAPKTRTFLIVLAAFILLALLLMVGSAAGGAAVLSAQVVSTPEERAAFLRECGWEVDIQSEQTQTIHIPETFSDVYQSYNDLQLQQGYDLRPYAGLDCTLYTYTVTNYPDQGQTVLVNLCVYKNRVIGGDVHSTNLNGFMIGLK